MAENLDDFVNEATGQNADGSSFTVEQLFAIRKAGELGKRLQEDFPEIVDKYRNGRTMPKISLEYCIQELYDASRNVALNAVRYALVGYDFDGISYPGLIEDDEELRNIGLEHKRESGKANYERGLGVHGRTAEQKSENSRKGGEAAYEMGKGIHGRTAEQMSEHGRKGGEAAYEMGKGIHGRTAEQMSEHGRKNAMARGFVPWVPAEETNEHYTFSELEIAFMFSQCPEYRRGKHVKGAKIADELNVIFHNREPVRKGIAVGVQLSNYQKDTRKRRVLWVPAEETNEHYTFSEVETALRLSQCPEYRSGSRIKNAKIADELNVIFHNEEPVRKGTTVGAQLSNYQKNVREVIS